MVGNERVFFGNQYVAKSKLGWYVLKAKFAVIHFFRELWRYMKLSFVVSAVVLFSYMAGTQTATTQAEVNEDRLATKVEQMKTQLIEDIAKKENEIGVPAIPDDNKRGTLPLKDKVSYGCMMYKISTVQLHYKTLYKKSLTDQEAATLAMDCTKAKALAKDAIFGIQGALWNWSVATKEMGNRVAFIRQLEQ